MTIKYVTPIVATLVTVFLFSLPARAQDGPGSRAAGMGGAFAAVADDASAVYWNPAGLASGPVLNVQVDFGAAESSSDDTVTVGGHAGRLSTRLIAVATPPLGLSYYRLSTLTATPDSPAAPGSNGREEERHLARRLTTNHFGLSLLQSVGGPLVVATTLKVIRGSVAEGTISGGTWDEVLDRGDDLEGSGRTQVDLDAGVMLNAGRVRVGLVARNLREADFAPDGEDETGATLERQVRLGVAWGLGWPGTTPVIASFDADLTRRPAFDGERRDVAVGAEAWGLQRRIGVRAGWRGSTVGERRPVGTAGISVGVWRGAYIDAHIARGGDERREWSVGARFTY